MATSSDPESPSPAAENETSPAHLPTPTAIPQPGGDPAARRQPSAASHAAAASPGAASPPEQGRLRRLVALTGEMLLLGLILAVAVQGQWWWLERNHVEPTGDHAYHVAQEAAYRNVLRSPGPPEEKLRTLVAWPGGYPPAVYAWTALFRPPSRVGDDPALASFALFIVLLGGGAYLVGRRLAGPAAGAAATAVVLSDPSGIACQHSYFLDMPQAALVVATLALLLACDDFSRRLPSLLLGVALGAGMLVKPTFSWYAALPVLGLAVLPTWRWLRESRWPARVVFVGVLSALPWVFARMSQWRGGMDLVPRHLETCVPWSEFLPAAWWLGFVGVALVVALACLRGAGSHVLACLLVAGGLAGPWMISNTPVLHARFLAYMNGGQGGLEALPRTLLGFREQIPAPVLVLAGVGLLGFILDRSRRPVIGVLVLALVPGLAWTLVSLGHTPRYLIPANALLGILAVAWVPRRFGLSWVVLPIFLAWGSVNLLGPRFMDPHAAWYPAFARLSAVTLRSTADDITDPVSQSEEGAVAIVNALPPGARRMVVVEVRGSEDDTIPFTDLAMQLCAWSRWKERPLLVEALRYDHGVLGTYNLEERGVERGQMLARWREEADLPYSPLSRTPPALVVLAGRPPDAAERVLRGFGPGYREGPPRHPRFTCFWRAPSP